MSLKLLFNPGEDRKTVPYLIQADLGGKVSYPDDLFEIPVKWENVGGLEKRYKDRYYVDVCGVRLEQPYPERLLEPLEKLFSNLTNLARLPSYVFIAAPSHKLYPIYTIQDEVIVSMPDGPFFKHVELAQLRNYLSDYLHSIRVLGRSGKTETLHVRGVRTKNLTLTRPVFYFKKRVADEEEFWAPVFTASDGIHIYTNAASARREVKIKDGLEVLHLRDKVATALIEDGRLNQALDLRPDRLFTAGWNRLMVHFQQLPQKYVINEATSNRNGKEFDLYHYAEQFIILEAKRNENRFGLFLGQNPAEALDRLSQDYTRRGHITTPASIKGIPEK